MKITVQRETLAEFEVDVHDITLLSLLNTIKTEQDSSLTFASGCRSSVCGSCSMRVNDKEVLACSYKVQDGDRVEPLNNLPLIRDLVVDVDRAYEKNKKAKAWLSQIKDTVSLTQENEKINEIQSDCILCASCYSACPVFAVNDDFLGPFTLTRVWKYVSDKREESEKEMIDTIQTDGVWSCTLCNECTVVCPQNISSKTDIEKLRSKSAMVGYSDPNFASFGGGFGFDGTPSF
ncbi:MAG: 2Fe-2S iron-sulfur cluster-binding protein [Campylobacterota bacterium]|nr:2Fe-2S iron-sulfur cluster-binding protein [Campylobacterota bacterium]